MSSPLHDSYSESSFPAVTLRRDHEWPDAQASEYVPLMVPAARARLISDSALARLGLLGGCLGVWFVVAMELLYAGR